MAEVSRDDAWELVTEWIEADSLRKHLLGVEAAMRAYARKWGEDRLLHRQGARERRSSPT